ncbi:MAG: putative Zn-dependent protease [Polaribacter sp.]|jgi:predicted Zn-dependent protease
MYFKKKNKVEKRSFNHFKLALFYFILFSINIFAQDSIPLKEDLTEEAELKFQEFFFKALSEKAIGNYQQAIENLESCNQISTNDVSVFFEFSKNYLLLNNTLLAKEYIERSLAKDINNLWMLKHLVKIYQKDSNYKEAIKIQQKIVAINPKERGLLAKLLVNDKQYKKAISLMNTLEKENTLSSNLKKLKANLEKKKEASVKKEDPSDLGSLINQFKTDKSYKVLKQILNQSSNNTADLLRFSEEGIALFPAQPFVYLVKGKTLNDLKKYKNALTTLQNGFDFVIDDKMEVDFYTEIAKAFKGLGNSKEEKKYTQKAKNLKN